MTTTITILWRVSGWKGFSVVACGHLHARPETYPLTEFQCWCEKPMFDSHGHDRPATRAETSAALLRAVQKHAKTLRVAAATRQDPASPSLPIEKETR